MMSLGHAPGSSWSRPGSPASTTIKCLASAAGDFLESLADLGYLTARIPVTVEAVADWLPNFRHLENSKVWLGLTVNALVSAELKQLTSERDRLLQDRHNTTRRVEAMLNRLKALGFE